MSLSIALFLFLGIPLLFAILTGIGIGFYKIFIRPDLLTMNAVRYRMDVDELFQTLDIIIANEILIYERYLTNSTDMEIGTALTNAQFINIYNDLSHRVLTAISDTFYHMAEMYMTKLEIQTYVTQRIYSYLAEKVSNNEPIGEELEDEDIEVS